MAILESAPLPIASVAASTGVLEEGASPVRCVRVTERVVMKCATPWPC